MGEEVATRGWKHIQNEFPDCSCPCTECSAKYLRLLLLCSCHQLAQCTRSVQRPGEAAEVNKVEASYDYNKMAK